MPRTAGDDLTGRGGTVSGGPTPRTGA
jgi:hypothetical protein